MLSGECRCRHCSTGKVVPRLSWPTRVCVAQSLHTHRVICTGKRGTFSQPRQLSQRWKWRGLLPPNSHQVDWFDKVSGLTLLHRRQWKNVLQDSCSILTHHWARHCPSSWDGFTQSFLASRPRPTDRPGWGRFLEHQAGTVSVSTCCHSVLWISTGSVDPKWIWGQVLSRSGISEAGLMWDSETGMAGARVITGLPGCPEAATDTVVE